MNKYPILKVTSGIIPELMYGKVSDIAIRLLETNPVNFCFQQIPLHRDVKKRFKDLQHALKEKVCLAHDNRLGPIIGYNRHYGNIMLSDPSRERGLVQVVDDSLIFNPNLSPLNKQIDSYLFASVDQYLVGIGFIDTVAEFLEEGYRLLKSEKIGYSFQRQSLTELTDLTPIDLKSLT